MTSLKNYIDFDSQIHFFEFFGLSIPRYLEEFMKTDNKLESSVLASEDSEPVDAPTTTTPTTTEPVAPAAAPVVKAPDATKPRDKDAGLIDDEGRQIDQTGGPITKRLALQFLDGTAQNTGNYR